MSYTLNFLSNKQVILATVVGTYTLEDARNLCKEIADFMDTIEHSCYILADISKMRTMPTNVIEMREATRPMFTHPRYTMMATFGSVDVAVVNFLGNTIARLFGISLKVFAQQNDAINAILTLNPNLNPSLHKDLLALGYAIRA